MAERRPLKFLRKKRAALDKAIRALEQVQRLESKIADDKPANLIDPEEVKVLPWLPVQKVESGQETSAHEDRHEEDEAAGRD